MNDMILSIAERLYAWWSNDSIDLVIQKNADGYHYFIVVMSGSPHAPQTFNNKWEIKYILCSGTGHTIDSAQHDLLSRLLQKARDVLEIPIEQIMNS